MDARTIDLLIWAGFLAACGIWLGLSAYLAKRHPLLVPKPDPVSVRARLVADHRERLSGAHVSAVRARDGRVGWALSPAQRHAIAQSKKRR